MIDELTPLQLMLALLTVHFVADFVLQSDWMAINKSSRTDALVLHVSVYTLPFAIFAAVMVSLPFAFWFALATWVLHFWQDFVTSRINARLWAANERHWFFVAIGADQLLHAYALALTWTWLVPALLVAFG